MSKKEGRIVDLKKGQRIFLETPFPEVWKEKTGLVVKVGQKVTCPFHKDEHESAVVEEHDIYCFVCTKRFSTNEVIAKVCMGRDLKEEKKLTFEEVEKAVMAEESKIKEEWKAKEVTEFQKRVEAAADAMNISTDVVIERLKQLGVKESDSDCIEMLDSEDITFADYCEVFIDTKITTKPRLRKAMRALKASSWVGDLNESVSKSAGVQEVLLSLKSYDRMTDRELLELYVKDENDQIKSELLKRAHGRAFIVYEPGKEFEKVNINVSLDLIKQARIRPIPDRYVIGDQFVNVYMIGMKREWVGSCPIHETPLFNGFCSECGFMDATWGLTKHETLSVIWFQVRKVEKTFPNSQLVREMFETAKLGFEEVCKKYPVAKLMMDRFKAENPSVALPPHNVRVDKIGCKQNSDEEVGKARNAFAK